MAEKEGIKLTRVAISRAGLGDLHELVKLMPHMSQRKVLEATIAAALRHALGLKGAGMGAGVIYTRLFEQNGGSGGVNGAK